MISTLTPTITRTIVNPNIIRNIPSMLPLPRYMNNQNN